MVAFLVDENMPRSTTTVLRTAGFDAVDVRDLGLRGHSDDDIFAYAQAHDRVIVTGDLDFANILSLPLGTHAGIVVMRVPNEFSSEQVNQVLLQGLGEVPDAELRGLLIIVELGRVRIRRPAIN